MDSDLLFCLRSAYCFLTESVTISYDSLSHYHGEHPKHMIFNMMFHDVFIPRMLHFNSFFVCKRRNHGAVGPKGYGALPVTGSSGDPNANLGGPWKMRESWQCFNGKNIEIIYTRFTLIIFTHSHIHTINYNFSLQSSWKYHAFMIWTGWSNIS